MDIEVDEMNGIMEWMKGHKPHAIALAVLAAAAICLAAAVACGAFSSTAPQEEQGTAQLTINVTADAGWDGESTPAIARIEGASVDFYHAINPEAEGNAGASTVELAEGDYTVSLIKPLNRDGSTYKLSETNDEQLIHVEADGGLSIDFAMKLIAAEDVTDEAIQDIVSQTKRAIAGGDETLKGDAGRSVLERLERNAAANPNASDETKEEAAKAEEEADVDGDPATSIPQASGSSGSGTGGTASEGGSSDGNASSSSGGTDGDQASAHTHNWKDHTATRRVWVENWVTVPDYETQTIYGARFYTMTSPGTYIANGPTYWFENGFTHDDLKAIIAEGLRNADENGLYNGVYYGNYQNVSKTEQVQVGSHQEDQGWYETETYVDYQYCDCGARK